MADARRRDAIWTHSGRIIRPLDPRPEDIAIEDIAHSLANQCRFTGHTKDFYSVAQHCVHVAELLPDELKFWGLLHDATEAYLSDIARPVKKAEPIATVYAEAEGRLMQAVAERFGIEMPEPKEVKEADNVMVRAEIRDLMPSSTSKRLLEKTPAPYERTDKIVAWDSRTARRIFLTTFKALSRAA